MAGGVLAALMLGAGFLHLSARIGTADWKITQLYCKAPVLDWIIAYFTVLPLIVGPIVYGWVGLAGAIVGQVASVLLWEFLHEMAHRDAVAGPRIVKVINGIIGPWRNHLATWLTAIVTPLFSLVRLAEIAIYPFIAMLAGFPQYKAGDWVNVSRQKFSGLVGHDLIWCLYCDWMTGVWSLGSEMLRNVESFWCPIRFASDKKCANCTVDFPDVSNGWVDAKGNMAQVAQTVADFHGHGTHSWFGHPARLTVKGEPIQTVADANKEVKS
jgi:hypothetical protein